MFTLFCLYPSLDRKEAEPEKLRLARDQQDQLGEPLVMFTASLCLQGAGGGLETCCQVLPTQLSPTYSQLPLDKYRRLHDDVKPIKAVFYCRSNLEISSERCALFIGEQSFKELSECGSASDSVLGQEAARSTSPTLRCQLILFGAECSCQPPEPNVQPQIRFTKRLSEMSVLPFHHLMVEVLASPSPLVDPLSGEETVGDKEAEPEPSHHRSAVTPADSGGDHRNRKRPLKASEIVTRFQILRTRLKGQDIRLSYYLYLVVSTLLLLLLRRDSVVFDSQGYEMDWQPVLVVVSLPVAQC
ncbi:unnamed protein product [Pleuronectes platessa]|uniref:Uncharacterized protein n=1 Tax=Pleuronectes platessa TaxID=8262 RepID=A0A9N7TJ53_PLEPL|nr:unnamed protein product [Pleuronectes platessa]